MKTVTVRLEPEQFEALQALSKATRVPQATYIRDGIAIILQQARILGAMQAAAEEDEVRTMLNQTQPPCLCPAGKGSPHHHLDRYKA